MSGATPLPWPLLPDATRPQTLDELAEKCQDNFDALAKATSSTTTPWTAVTAFLNGWVNFGGADQVAQYRKDSLGQVHVRGIIKNGTIGLAAFTLPVGYRPLATQRFAVPSNNAFGYAQVDSGGNVSVPVGSNVWAQIDTMKFWTD